jgi:chlorite dismutase
MMPVLHFCFGDEGQWRGVSSSVITGPGLPDASRLEICADPLSAAVFSLRGTASNVRYATRKEVADLRAIQEDLGRPAATCAALIPIRKSEAWWSLAQDERRAIFEEKSRHHTIGISYLPEIARKLYHCRDLGEEFDFLTWFEFAPEDEAKFDRLVGELRASEEWRYVTREIDMRFRRAD